MRATQAILRRWMAAVKETGRDLPWGEDRGLVRRLRPSPAQASPQGAVSVGTDQGGLPPRPCGRLAPGPGARPEGLLDPPPRRLPRRDDCRRSGRTVSAGDGMPSGPTRGAGSMRARFAAGRVASSTVLSRRSSEPPRRRVDPESRSRSTAPGRRFQRTAHTGPVPNRRHGVHACITASWDEGAS
jgi:hypothetical protein